MVAGIAIGISIRVVLSGMLEGWTFKSSMYPAMWYVYTTVASRANLVTMVIVSFVTAKSHPPIRLADIYQE